MPEGFIFCINCDNLLEYITSTMLTEKEIKHIAELARIELTEKEEEKMKDELSSVLDYVVQLNKVNTDQVEPLYQTTGLVNSIRKDEHRTEPSEGQIFEMDEKLNKALIGQAPEKENSFIKVRSVLSK